MNLICLSGCLFVRFYTMNVKTVKPNGPKLCMGQYMDAQNQNFFLLLCYIVEREDAHKRATIKS